MLALVLALNFGGLTSVFANASFASFDLFCSGLVRSVDGLIELDSVQINSLLHFQALYYL